MPAFASAAAAEPVADDPVGADPGATEPVVVPRRRESRRRKRQPRYHVILWNDDDHTYQYVVRMLRTLFGHPPATGFRLAREVDTQGRVIVLTTTLEHAELKRDQIHAFGADRLIARSKGSMSASIEPVAAE
jgi:ATP-dependent Clp protease adaptor protein ClpS